MLTDNRSLWFTLAQPLVYPEASPLSNRLTAGVPTPAYPGNNSVKVGLRPLRRPKHRDSKAVLYFPQSFKNS